MIQGNIFTLVTTLSQCLLVFFLLHTWWMMMRFMLIRPNGAHCTRLMWMYVCILDPISIRLSLVFELSLLNVFLHLESHSPPLPSFLYPFFLNFFFFFDRRCCCHHLIYVNLFPNNPSYTFCCCCCMVSEMLIHAMYLSNKLTMIQRRRKKRVFNVDVWHIKSYHTLNSQTFPNLLEIITFSSRHSQSLLDRMWLKWMTSFIFHCFIHSEIIVFRLCLFFNQKLCCVYVFIVYLNFITTETVDDSKKNRPNVSRAISNRHQLKKEKKGET